jgi:alpha-tubulin suppressor-like RCC1 family protein
MALGLLFSGCDLFMNDDTPSPGSKTPGNDQGNDQGNHQTEDQGGGSPIEITGFPITSPGSESSFGHALLLKSDGTVWATGSNQYGQFGNGTKINDYPYATADFTQVANRVVSLGVIDSINDSFIIKDDGSLWAAGNNSYEIYTSATTTFEKEVSLGSGVKAVSVSRGIYVLKEDGSLWVRGTGTNGNGNGQLGLGHKNDVTDWTKVIDSGVVAIAKSQYFGLVLTDDGIVLGAGNNYFGALGKGPAEGMSYADITSFTPIFNDGTKAKAIAVGSSNHSLILKNDGTVLAAGHGSYGKLGNGQTGTGNTNVQTTFAPIQGVTGVITAISVGNNHSVVLTSDGTVWAAGRNNYGQLGLPQATSLSGTFTSIISGVKQISAQGDQTFIVKNDGTLWVTGYVNTGILGNSAKTKYYGFEEITLPELPE